MLFPHPPIYRAGQGPLTLSNFSNFQTGNHVLNQISAPSWAATNVGRMPNPVNEPRALEKISDPATTLMHSNENNSNEKAPFCKLFGYSLTEDPATHNLQGQSKRNCTKVHKQASLVGRTIYFSRLHGYNEWLTELEQLFNMEGLLYDPEQGWRVLYTDQENDMMVVGDDPWNEFVEVATNIRIYTQEEVEKLTIGTNSDDN